MHYKNGKILHFYNHLKRLKKSVKIIAGYKWDEESFLKDLHQYMDQFKDHEYVIRVQFQMNQQPNFIFSRRDYPYGKKEIRVGILPQLLLPTFPLSWIKRSDRTLYEIGEKYASKEGYDDVILLNTKGFVCESTIANVIIRKGNVYTTPPLKDGCVDGIQRRKWITEGKMKKLNIFEESISIDDLITADEVLLCNAVRKIYKIKLIYDAHTLIPTKDIVQQTANY